MDLGHGVRETPTAPGRKPGSGREHGTAGRLQNSLENPTWIRTEQTFLERTAGLVLSPVIPARCRNKTLKNGTEEGGFGVLSTGMFS